MLLIIILSGVSDTQVDDKFILVKRPDLVVINRLKAGKCYVEVSRVFPVTKSTSIQIHLRESIERVPKSIYVIDLFQYELKK